jgi:hypothetical protein
MTIKRPKVGRDDPFVAAVIGWFAETLAVEKPHVETPVYLVGGLAVRCYAPSRVTEDFEFFSDGARIALPPTSLTVSHGGRTYRIVHEPQHNPAFGALHDGYADRSIRLVGNPGDLVRLHVLHPVDIAITKLQRKSDADEQDIMALAGTGSFSASDLSCLGEEAIADIIGNRQMARLNLRDLVERIEREIPKQERTL